MTFVEALWLFTALVALGWCFYLIHDMKHTAYVRDHQPPSLPTKVTDNTRQD